MNQTLATEDIQLTEPTNSPEFDPDKLNSFMERALNDLAAAYGGIMVSLGNRLGLYKSMADGNPLTSTEIAVRSGCAERYVREWLNAQAAAGYIEYHADADAYRLPPEHAFVLADDLSPAFIPPAWQVPASMWMDEEQTIKAFRAGEGVAWGERNGRLHCGVAAFYRNGYRGSLVQEWLPAMAGVTDQLEQGIAVADVGCGHGHSTVLMAKAFPRSTFHGFDSHEPSLRLARRNAMEANVEDRAVFKMEGAYDFPDHSYGLICFFDCLHDLGDPVAAAKRAAATLAPGGSVLLVEPFASDRTDENFTLAGRLYYAGSTTICCAHAMSEGGKQVLGAQAGERKLREVFSEAGFRTFRRVAETPFNLIIQAQL